ncbi:MAG TPA: hypothetical protein VIG68_07820 [Lysobacter sp.]
MRSNVLGAGVLMVAFALSGCQQDRDTATAANPNPGHEVTPNEAASQAPAAPPQTQSTAQTETGMPGAPEQAAGGQGITFMASQTPGPGGAPYLVDTAGTAVYILEGDRDGTKCTGECQSTWPPVTIDKAQAAASGTLPAAANMGTVQRADGTVQVTYNAQPLYRYAADSGRGSTAGHGVKDKWGQWRLLNPQGEPIAAAPAAR